MSSGAVSLFPCLSIGYVRVRIGFGQIHEAWNRLRAYRNDTRMQRRPRKCTRRRLGMPNRARERTRKTQGARNTFAMSYDGHERRAPEGTQRTPERSSKTPKMRCVLGGFQVHSRNDTQRAPTQITELQCTRQNGTPP